MAPEYLQKLEQAVNDTCAKGGKSEGEKRFRNYLLAMGVQPDSVLSIVDLSRFILTTASFYTIGDANLEQATAAMLVAESAASDPTTHEKCRALLDDLNIVPDTRISLRQLMMLEFHIQTSARARTGS